MSRFKLLCLTVSLALFALAGTASSASAAPIWSLLPDTTTYSAPGATKMYFLRALNVGDAPSSGQYRVVIAFPAGVTALSQGSPTGGWSCAGTTFPASTATCTRTGGVSPGGASGSLNIATSVAPEASGPLSASYEIAGGGATRFDGTACGQAPTFDPPVCAWASQTTIVTTAPPQFGVYAFDGQVTADPLGTPFTQAGGHPHKLSTHIDFKTALHPTHGEMYPVEPTKNIVVDLPPGLVGNPTALAECTIEQIAPEGPQIPECPAESQVGTALIRSAFGNTTSAPFLLPNFNPVYNMVPPPDAPARFAMNIQGTIVTFDAEPRTGSDYGLTVKVRNMSEGLAVFGTTVTFWGFPADSSHDAIRFCPGTGPGCASTAPNEPLLRMPTSCPAPGVGLLTTLRTDSWVNPGDFKTASFESHLPPGYPVDPSEWGAPQGPEGCEELSFEPSMTIQPTKQSASTPTGLVVDLAMPQEDDPNTGLAPSDLRKAVVTLPEGMSVNPASANGLEACSAAQIDLDGHNTEPTCPDSSKLGSLTIDTPLLEEQLSGNVHLARQGDNPFGSLLAVYLVAKGPGVVIKLPGKVTPTASGRLVTSFDNQPQLPFEKLHLEFFGGPQAALVTPPTCGDHESTAVLTPWSGNPAQVSSDSFPIVSGPGGGPCPPSPAGFDPQLSAGLANPIAGSSSPFNLKLTREDGTQRFSSLSVTTPEGLSAYLKGIPYCPDATLGAISDAIGTGALESASSSCPAASQVGTVVVGAGAGSSPFYVPTGRVYLAGPYKGAPLSLAIVTPALAGPFDLGNVVVRSAIHLDPTTAKITVKSDPIPQILHGIPLDLRDIRVSLDRPDFTLAPTSCEEMSVDGQVLGSDGATADVSRRFQVGACAALGFKPRLKLNLRGGTKRGAHPALRAELRMPSGGANISRAAVTLPSSAFLAQNHLKNICTRVNFAAGACPKGSRYGFARAWSPLLDQTLSGPVYLRSSDNTLPDMVVALRGPDHQPIEIELVGRIDAVKVKGGTGIRSTFAQVPDVPVSKFVLRMKGGKKGLIQNSRNLCRGKNRANVKFDGHNGKIRDLRPLVRVRCARGKSRAAR